MKYKILGFIFVFLITAGVAGATEKEVAEKTESIEKHFLTPKTLNALITQVTDKYANPSIQDLSVKDLYTTPTTDPYSTDPYSTGAEKIRKYVENESIFNQITSSTYDKVSFLNILEKNIKTLAKNNTLTDKNEIIKSALTTANVMAEETQLTKVNNELKALSDKIDNLNNTRKLNRLRVNEEVAYLMDVTFGRTGATSPDNE